MKPILVYLFLFIIILSSCSNRSLPSDYEVVAYQSAYGYNIKSKKIEKITIDYVISNTTDVFNLYTINQNYLPIGYSSCCYTNVTLLKVEESDDVITYTVDNYIKLVDNIEVFCELLTKTNLLLYDKNTIIINNNTIIAKSDKN